MAPSTGVPEQRSERRNGEATWRHGPYTGFPPGRRPPSPVRRVEAAQRKRVGTQAHRDAFPPAPGRRLGGGAVQRLRRCRRRRGRCVRARRRRRMHSTATKDGSTEPRHFK